MVIIENRQILMVRQTYRGETIWTFPGGSIEPSETPKEAAVREVAEEVNLKTEAICLLYQGLRTNATGTYYCYLGRILSGHAILGSDPELAAHLQELHEIRWCPVDEVREHPEVQRIYDKLVDNRLTSASSVTGSLSLAESIEPDR